MAKDAGLVWKPEVPHFVQLLLWAPPSSSGSLLWRSWVKEWEGVGELLTFRVFYYLSKGVDENRGFGLTCSTLHFHVHLTTQFFAACLLLPVSPHHVYVPPVFSRPFHFLSLPWKRGRRVLAADVLYMAFILAVRCTCAWAREGSFTSHQTEFPQSLLVVVAGAEVSGGQKDCCPVSMKSNSAISSDLSRSSGCGTRRQKVKMCLWVFVLSWQTVAKIKWEIRASQLLCPSSIRHANRIQYVLYTDICTMLCFTFSI